MGTPLTIIKFFFNDDPFMIKTISSKIGGLNIHMLPKKTCLFNRTLKSREIRADTIHPIKALPEFSCMEINVVAAFYANRAAGVKNTL